MVYSGPRTGEVLTRLPSGGVGIWACRSVAWLPVADGFCSPVLAPGGSFFSRLKCLLDGDAGQIVGYGCKRQLLGSAPAARALYTCQGPIGPPHWCSEGADVSTDVTI